MGSNVYLQPSDPKGYMRGWEGWDHPERAIILGLVHDGETMLDVGCGAGITYESIVKHGRLDIKYKGVDYSQKFIGACKEMFPDALWEKQSGNRLREESNSWDVVYIRNTLECMRYYRRPIKEAWRVARRLVILTFWNLLLGDQDDIKKEGTRTWGNRYGREKLARFLHTINEDFDFACVDYSVNGRWLGRYIYTLHKNAST